MRSRLTPNAPKALAVLRQAVDRLMGRTSSFGAADEGVALVLSLCLMLVASVVGASLMLLSQTETYASLNYRTMTQARYAAESGVHSAINYILYTYPAPVADATYAQFDTTKSPVQYNGLPVVLSSNASVTANYPDAPTSAAFAAAAAGSLAAGGNNTVGYTTSATLLSMTRFFEYGSGTEKVIQTWLITADGTTSGARPADVEVSAVLEQQKVSFNMYGFFATNNQCGALTFGGGEYTDSYDSSQLGNASAWSGGAVGVGSPVTQNNDGNVGTNGNLDELGNSIVNGTLSTPRAGVGKCSAGAVDALTQNGGATVTGGVSELPQPVTYATPAAPSPLPPQVSMSGGSCAGLGLTGVNCTPYTGASGAGIKVTPSGSTPIVLGDVSLTGGAVLYLDGGTYNINSLTLHGNSSIVVNNTATNGPVVLDVAGTNNAAPLDISGGISVNLSYNPENLQIVYGGTGTMTINGGSAAAMAVYAPNAAINLVGGAAIYGSVLGATINDHGGVGVHYDRHLPNEFGTAWNTMLSSFNWKKS